MKKPPVENFRDSYTDNAKVIKVIRIESYFGDGTKESPGRTIAEYWTLDGELLAVRDIWREKQNETK